jgi:hypothetical protein
MAPYLLDLRTRVLADWDQGISAKELVAKYRVSRAWVNRLVQRRRETGDRTPAADEVSRAYVGGCPRRSPAGAGNRPTGSHTRRTARRAADDGEPRHDLAGAGASAVDG